jgi:hypothetical protein
MNNESNHWYDDEEDSLSDDESFFADPATKKRFSEFCDILSKTDSLQCMRKRNKMKNKMKNKNPPVPKMASLENDELIERFLSASSIKLASLIMPESRSKEFIPPVKRKSASSFIDVQRRA